MKKLRSLALVATCCVFGASAVPSAAGPADFLSRFAGTWTGGGTVMPNTEIGPIKVNCQVTGKPSGNRMRLSGTCRAALVFTRDIGADIQMAGDGSYVGTYTGSKIGAARLSGRASANAVNLTTTWPKVVYGDTKAVMTLTNNGNGRFSMIVTDRVDGKSVRTTQVNFQRKA